MKTIWLDLGHPAQLNFYQNTIKHLCKNYNILITVLDRGKLARIAKKELAFIPNVKLFILGRHRGNKISVILEANIFRLIILFSFLVKNKVDLHFSNGYPGSLLSKIFRFPAITFGDDPHNLNYKLKLAFADKVYLCLYSDEFVQLNKRAEILKCVKEWAYLNPKYFVANKDELLKYGVKPYQYIFIREVSTGTINYAGQRYGLIKELSHKIPAKYKVLFSLEDKSKKEWYPEDWTLLQEPVEDIHSLIYYSRALVSSGDSMAREAAVLGIPSFYVGNRKMAGNEALKKLVDLFQVDVKNFEPIFLNHIENFSVADQIRNIAVLEQQFIDINDFVVNTAKNELE